MRSALETTDIFRGAFFLCNGARLSEVRFSRDNHRIVSFLIEGEEIDRLDLDYRSGQALVNPLLLKETLNQLRDILFNTLREKNGGKRYDRERKDPYDQATR